MNERLRLAYLIFTHKYPAHLSRLLQRLYVPGCTFYVHIDAKADLKAFQQAVGDTVPARSVVWLKKRRRIYI